MSEVDDLKRDLRISVKEREWSRVRVRSYTEQIKSIRRQISELSQKEKDDKRPNINRELIMQNSTLRCMVAVLLKETKSVKLVAEELNVSSSRARELLAKGYRELRTIWSKQQDEAEG